MAHVMDRSAHSGNLTNYGALSWCLGRKARMRRPITPFASRSVENPGVSTRGDNTTSNPDKRRREP